MKVFGSQKWKLDTHIGANKETHRSDTINFSRPHPAKKVTKAYAAILPTIVEELVTYAKQVQPLPLAGTNVHCVTAVQESKINERTWHIARVPKTSIKAHMAVTKKKCIACIVMYGKSTLAPTYSELWHNMRLNHEEHIQFFFCSNDIERYVKGSHCKQVIPYSNTLERPSIPITWLVEIGTNFTNSKMEALENVGFQLLQRKPIIPNQLFRNSTYLSISRVFNYQRIQSNTMGLGSLNWYNGLIVALLQNNFSTSIQRRLCRHPF